MIEHIIRTKREFVDGFIEIKIDIDKTHVYIHKKIFKQVLKGVDVIDFEQKLALTKSEFNKISKILLKAKSVEL